jgi:hypothetical protein
MVSTVTMVRRIASLTPAVVVSALLLILVLISVGIPVPATSG